MLKQTIYRLAAYSLFIFTLLSTSGCLYYTARSLRTQVYGCKVENKLIKVTARELAKNDLDFYFKTNLNKAKVRAIQVNIFNQGAQAIVLDGRSIDLELEDAENIASKIYYNVPIRVILWVVPAIFWWPFLFPAAADGYNAWVQNKRIAEDIDQKTLNNHSKITIRPYSTISRVMFVRENNYYNNFTLSFTKKEDKETVDLFVNV